MESHKFKKFYKLFLIRCQLFIKENKLWIRMFIIINLNCKITSAGSSPGSINIQTQNKKTANNVIIVTHVQLTFRSWGFWVFFIQGVSPQMKRIYLSAQVHKLTPPPPLHTTFPTPDYHHSQTLGLKQSQLRIVMKSRIN